MAPTLDGAPAGRGPCTDLARFGRLGVAVEIEFLCIFKKCR